MKKIKYIFLLFILGLAACNPNEEIYKQLDAAQEPYNETFDYTLKDADYTTIKNLALPYAENATDSANAKAIETYKSFSAERPSQNYVPLFLEATFLALDSSSAIKVHYNYDYSHIFSTDEILNNTSDTLTSSQGGQFKDTLAILFPQAVQGNMALVKYTDITDDTTTGYFVYYFDEDQWTWLSGTYVLTDEDYESMGNPGPGHYHNFSSDYPPEKYLPVFLKQKYPYAAEGDAKSLLYKYYSGGNQYHYAKYFFDGNTWNSKEEKADQFIHNGTQWLFDPTLHIEMTCDDYQIIVDWIKNNDTLSGYMHPDYDNTEYYFGASSYYCNFDMRVYKRRDYDVNHYLDNLDDEQALQVLFDRLQYGIEIMLETKYPDAQPVVNGVQYYVEVTFSTYEPTRHKYSMLFKCIAQGDFEYVEDSFTLVE